MWLPRSRQKRCAGTGRTSSAGHFHRQELRQARRACRCHAGSRRRRSGRPARAKRRGQDDLLLFDHGAGEARFRPRRAGEGVDINRPPMYRRAILGLGYLPQETSILPRHDGRGEYPLRPRAGRADKAVRAEKLETLLREFGLARLRSSSAMALSGGERRRCEDCARAGRQSVDHPARRALCRHRSALHRRHSRPGEGLEESRHRRAHHRS